MKTLEEWEFVFSVSAPAPIPYGIMDELMMLEAVAWAEKHQLGIGGGFRSSSKQHADSDRVWHFKFGLCVQQVGQLIPRSVAYELFEFLAAWCKVHDYTLSGGFREFSMEWHESADKDQRNP